LGSAVADESDRQQGESEADIFHEVVMMVVSVSNWIRFNGVAWVDSCSVLVRAPLIKPDDDKPPRRRRCHPVR
jgi:hypothetical protein